MRPNRRFLPLAALLLGLGLAACDSTSALHDADPAAPELPSLAEAVSGDLALSASAARTLRATLARYDGRTREPGVLWRAAADLQQTLTEAQKTELFERARDGRLAQRRSPERRQHFQQRMAPRRERIAEALELSSEQQAEMERLREAHREEMRALRTQVRSDGLDREAARARFDALHGSHRARIEAVLTADQRALVAQHRAEREAQRSERQAAQSERVDASRAVMAEVLDLTPQQQTALQSLRGDRPEQGRMRRGARGERAEALAQILDEDQLETVRLHRLLSHRVLHVRMQQRMQRR